MQYRYIERNAMGYVEFQTSEGPVRMETGEAVEVPESLAKKLANNDHFEAVTEDGSVISAPKRRGRPPKVRVETDENDAGGA